MMFNFSLKKILPRTLFARSLLILTLPIILALIISIYIFFDGHWSKTASRLVVGVAAETSYLVEEVEKNKDIEFIENLAQRSLKHFNLNLEYMADGAFDKNESDHSGRGEIIRNILSRELDQVIEQPYDVIVDTQDKWTQIRVQLSHGVLIITSPQKRLFSSTGYVFLIWMVGVSIILLTVAILFMRNQIRPIKRLSLAAERFGKGRDVPFFKPEGAREVRAAARSFIGMRDRINRQIQQRTSMLAGVSHDLRTPLTRMKLQVEMMPESDDQKAIKNDIEDMERMINAYLQFAKGDGSEEMERTNILDILQRQEDLLVRDNFDVSLTVEKNVTYEIFVRPVAFERCIGNVISNAQKYAKAVWIDVVRDEDFVTLTFDDNGAGIAPENYEDVFKPFYREEKSRNSKTGGVGLGLPIAQDIILAHGGQITLDKSPQGGLRVVIQIPV